MKTKTLLAGLSLALLIACLAWSYQVTLSLVFGWLLFLYHAWPRLTVDWPSVSVGSLAVVLFLAGIHVAGRSWNRRALGRPRWRFRWSLAMVAVVFLLFTSGIALVGIVHQAGWMLTARDAFYVRSIRWEHGYSPNNLHELAIAALNYADSNHATFSPGGSFTPQGEMLHSWETYSLPYLGYSIDEIDFKLPWNQPRNAKAFRSVPSVFLNGRLPSPPLRDEQGFGLSHYAANVHLLGANTAKRPATDIPDGAANTILIGEINTNFQPWGHPVNWRDPARGINRSPQGFGGPPYAGGAYFAMADGRVCFINERVSPDVLHALGTPAGGEEIDTSLLQFP